MNTVVGLLIAIVGFVSTQSKASEKIYVGIEPAEDRWITLADGSKVFQGIEVSYLLGHKLWQSDTYVPILLRNSNFVQDDPKRMAQIPKDWQDWLTFGVETFDSQTTAPLDFKITPIVETLVYSSGKRGNKVVYGFSPDHLNPFNEGRSGSLENQYVASQSQLEACEKPDFYNGQFNTVGFGPFASNFGSNADEGYVIQLAGYGLGFKQKVFKVKSQIRFVIEDIHMHTSKEVVVNMKAKGQDFFFVGAYQGYTLGIEIQRRETLTQALRKILPKIIDRLIVEGFTSTDSINMLMAGDAPAKQIDLESEVEINKYDHLTDQQSQIAQCVEPKKGRLASIIEGLFAFVGVIKYFTVFDQPLHHPKLKTYSDNPVRIALIDSGIDYNDREVNPFIKSDGKTVRGFDFISWDPRPSDDNGHGSAAAKLLVRTLKKYPVEIIPIKVIGSRGETHSSAVYDGFEFALKNNADIVVVPWTSMPETMKAYEMGALKLASAGVSVFVPEQMYIQKHPKIFLPTKTSSTDFRAHSLGGATVRLPTSGVAVIEEVGRQFNSHGGRL